MDRADHLGEPIGQTTGQTPGQTIGQTIGRTVFLMQRSLLHIGGPLLCVVLTIGLLLTGKSAIGGRESASLPDLALETPDLTDVPSLGEEPAGETPDVAAGAEAEETRAKGGEPATTDALRGDDALAGDADGAPPVPDAAATKPQTVTAAPLAPPQTDPQASGGTELEEAVLRHPIAVSAGLVSFDGRLIQIEGLRPQSPDRVCTTSAGPWPCGTVARTAFRNFIRARAFTCQTPRSGWEGTLTARCTVGRDDPALWLARNGWAETDAATGPLHDAVETARRTVKGFYRLHEAPPLAMPPREQTGPGPDEAL
jgi:endonuclease YncB( thermonuclease family)